MKKIITILVLVSLFVAGDVWAISGRLGGFGVGDSIDVPYYAYNCSGSKRAVTCDSVAWWVNKDTLGHYAMPVDSGKVTATTAPSFAVSAGRGFVNYFLRVCANAGNHAPGRYTAMIEAWDDTCSQMHIVWWDCYTDSTTHEYAKNNRIIAGAVKAKTDNLPSDPADQSLIMAEVENLDGGTLLTTSDNIGINWADVSNPSTVINLSSTTMLGDVRLASCSDNAITAAAIHGSAAKKMADSVHFADTTQYSGSDTTMGQMAINAATVAIGDTNSNPFQAGTDNVFLTGNYAQIANDNYDTMFVHKSDFHSDGDTNSNPFQAGTDDVFLSTNYKTAADTFWLADTSQYSSDDDSTMAGTMWRLKNLYDNQSNWTTATGFAVAGDPMTLQSDSLKILMGDVDDVKGYTYLIKAATDASLDDSLGNLKNVATRAGDTTLVHAPHGDDWASAGAGSGLDSSTTSRILKRVVWGLAAEAGDDSTTVSERKIGNSGSGATAQEVWEYDLAGEHFDGDSTQAGDYMRIAAACGSGIGTRTVTITVKNAADSVAISGFEINVYDSSSGEPQANGTTNSNGVYTCSLDDETYTVHITNPPWSLTSPRRFVITANMDSTFYATRFTPGSPPADSLCVVWGRVNDKHGDPYVGAKVSIWMDAYPVTFGGILIDVATKSVVYTDTLGVFEFSDGIYYSSSLNPSNLKWKVRVKTKNAEWIWEGMVAVPSQASWEIEIPDL